MKIAVILMNMGGPKDLDSVQPFLFNLFYDKAILNIPNPLRYLIAKLISKTRTPIAKEIYENMGGKSPILEMTEAQKNSLSSEIGENFEVFIAMRYTYPRAFDVIEKIKVGNFEKIILLPLYPQFSSTTTGSSFDEWDNLVRFKKINIPTIKIGCYFGQENFIEAHYNLLKKEINNAKDKGFDNPKIIFSAHGLPEKVIKKGDPYQYQIEETVKLIISKFDTKPDYIISYQSRVGPIQWIKPYTDHVIKEVASNKRPIIVVPIAFVSEHSETLVELDIEYKKLALENNAPYYGRVPTLGIDPNYIKSLGELVKNAASNNIQITSWQNRRLCPGNFQKCRCI